MKSVFKDKTINDNFADRYRNLIMALLFNIPAVYLILMSNLHNTELTVLSFFYISCVIIGYYILPLLLITSILFTVFYPLRKIMYGLIITTVTLFVYYLFIDHFVYAISKLHIDLFWLEVIINDYEGFGLPISTIRNVFFVFFGFIAIEIFVFSFAKRLKKPKLFVTFFLIAVILSFGISQVIHIFAYENNDQRITSLSPHLPVYVPIISRGDARKYGGLFPLGENDINSETQISSSLKYPLKDMKFEELADKKLPNVLIIFLESWRFDMFNEAITPNIYNLSLKSSVFNNHLCSGNSTVAGVFGFFYGLHPTYWTSVKANSAIIDNPVFIDALKDNNYSFGVFAKSNFNRHKIKDTMFNGIDVDESFAGNTLVEQDTDLTRKLQLFINEQSGKSNPYMAFAFFKSNHFPYHYPKEDSIFLPAEDINLMFTDDDTDPTNYLNDFKNANHFVDGLIGGILRQIDSLGEMENTVIVITTDHGDELNDNKANYWGHGSNFTKYQTMVPLVIYYPEKEPRQINYPTTHVDIVPTLMRDIFYCQNDSRDYSNGIYLFEEQIEERPFVVGNYVNHAFIFGDNVYEIYPMYTKKYKLDDVTMKASSPAPQMLKSVMEAINRFYLDDDEIDSN